MKKRFAFFLFLILALALALCGCNKPVDNETEYASVSVTREQALEKLDALASTSGYRIEINQNGQTFVHAKRGSFTLFDNHSFVRYEKEYKAYTYSNGSWLFDKKMSYEEFEAEEKVLSDNFFDKLFYAQSFEKLVAVDGGNSFVLTFTENTQGENVASGLQDKTLNVIVDKEYGLTLKISEGDVVLSEVVFEKNYSVPTLPYDPQPDNREAPTFIKGASALDKLEGNFEITYLSDEKEIFVRRYGDDWYFSIDDEVSVFIKKETGYAYYGFNRGGESNALTESVNPDATVLNGICDLIFDFDGTSECSLSTWLQMSSDYLDGTNCNVFHTVYDGFYKGENKNVAGISCQRAVYEDFFAKTEYLFAADTGILFEYSETTGDETVTKFRVTYFSLDVESLGYVEYVAPVEPEPEIEPEPVVADVSLEDALQNASDLLNGELYLKISFAGGTEKELYYFVFDEITHSATATDGEILYFGLQSNGFTKITGTSTEYRSDEFEYSNRGENTKEKVRATAANKRAEIKTLCTTLFTEYFDEEGQIKQGFAKTVKDGFVVYSKTAVEDGVTVTVSYFVNDDGLCVKRTTESSDDALCDTDYEITFDTAYRYPFE